uniref:Serpin domain-containing protein n=1 Tax=Megaselia scalaris TaxID=36166 RepID=T1GWX2_MEGSC
MSLICKTSDFLVFGLLAAMSLQALASEEPLFAVDLYKSISTKDNLVFSPYSIQSCLGLAYMGAGGETASELAKGLRFGSVTKDEVANSFAGNNIGDLMKIANKIFLNKNYVVGESFAQLSKKSFNSGAENLNFADSIKSEKHINDWVENETNGKIKELLSPGTGEWESPFPNLNTRQMEFFSSPSVGKNVDFMYDDEYFYYGELDDLQATAVEMKYKNGDFSMVIVLPNDKDGLEKLAEKVQNNYNLMSVSERLTSKKIDIYIPKFEMEHELDLVGPLQKLGIKSMFEDSADFSNLFDGNAPAVKISKAVHKAVIKVDEAGSEASAATYLKAYPMSLSLDQKKFVADHPFLWYIKDKSNIYFMGQVTKFLVQNMTNGEIDSVFAPGTIDRDTSVMLINAISFKGKWASPFPAINTLTMDFYPNSNKAQKVEFMFDEDYFNFGIIEKLDAKVLELSYKNCNLSMIILLPNQMDGLENLIEEFHKEYYFDQISKSLSFENKVDVYIPKFKMDFEIDLKSALLKMGVKTMFTSEADFRDFFEGIAPKLTVSKVSHKAEIKVDEEGAEASASTYIKAYPMSLDLGKKTFKADHPFIWYIKDKKDNIYFMGQVVDPTVNL